MVAQARIEEANAAKRQENSTLQDTVAETVGQGDQDTRMSPLHVLLTDRETGISGVGVVTQKEVVTMTMSMDGVAVEGAMVVVGLKVAVETAQVEDQVLVS